MDKIAIMLRKRYIAALSLIAILVITANFATHSLIDKQSHDSRIINLAGKQRMLSQKITKEVYQLPFITDETEKHEMLDELIASIDLWERTHKGLQSGDAELMLPGNNPEVVQTIFDDIQDEHEAILSAARKIIELTINEASDSEIKLYREVIRLKEPVFLKGMDEIVFKYDDLARIKVKNMQSIEGILLIMTLSTLVLEAVFIFLPAERLVNKSIRGLKANEENLQELFDTAPAMSLLIALDSKKLLRMNLSALEMLGIPPDDQKERFLYDFVEVKYLEPLNKLAESNDAIQMPPIEVVVRNLSSDGTPMMLIASRLFYHNEEVLLVNFSDLSEQKKNEAVLKNLASVDEMSGMLNRRTGFILYEKAFEVVKRHKNSLSVCFIDLDGLKRVNDTLGHLEGDRFIKIVARAILKNIRTEDIAFRYGGDEFVIIFNQCDGDYSKAIMERIREECSAIKNMKELSYEIDFSFGIATWNDGPDITIEELVEIADEKMYKDKLSKFPDRQRS